MKRFNLKSRISEARKKLDSVGSGLKNKKINLDRKYLNRLLEVRVERVPSLSEIFQKSSKLIIPLFFILGLLASDLLIRTLSYFFLTQEPETKVAQSIPRPKHFVRSKSSYEEIISKNIFCPGCPVPDMKMIAINRPKDCNKAKPLRSSATLVGTIVLSNANYSVATLTDGAQTYALKRGEEFKNLGKVFEIRRNRVCFENQDGLLFFLTLPDVEEITPNTIANSSTAGKKQISKGITQISENDLELEKNFIIEQLGNPNLLYEAYATEYKVDGEIQGFRIHSINPGSTIEKLGFKPGDIITEVDGKPMDSVARAQEMYNAAATTTEMNISILRDGNKITKSFSVK